jgi:hypothetical protein
MEERRTPSRRGRRTMRRRGRRRKRVQGTMMRGWGGRSALGSVSTRWFRSSHLDSPPLAHHGDNRAVIIPCGDGKVSHPFVFCFNYKFHFNLLTFLCV